MGENGRIFKVLKTPVPLELHPHELQSVLGYEFFEGRFGNGKDPGSWNEIFGPEAQKDFWIKLDVPGPTTSAIFWRSLEPASETNTKWRQVFLAETTK